MSQFDSSGSIHSIGNTNASFTLITRLIFRPVHIVVDPYLKGVIQVLCNAVGGGGGVAWQVWINEN